jgi:hypothetical protein
MTYSRDTTAIPEKLKLGNGQRAAFWAQIAKLSTVRVRNVNLLQRVRSVFQTPTHIPRAPISVTEADGRIGGSRSKRAQIKAILRRYEQGAVSQAEAVEELLKVMR